MRAFIRRYKWLLLTAAWLFVAVLTYIGYSEHYRITGQYRTPLDILYTIQKPFKMGVTESPASWQLELARWLGAVVTLSTLFIGLLVAFRERAALFFLRRRRGGHIVFCGLDPKSLHLAKEYRAAGRRVVIIEPDERHRLLSAVRVCGAIPLFGDSRRGEILADAAVERAEQVFVTGPDDGGVVETVAALYDHVSARQLPGTVVAHAQVTDLKLFGLLKRHRMFTEPHPRFDLHLFNTYVNSARQALAEFPLDRERIWVGDERTVQLVLVGFGQMGEALAVQAARIGHFANGRRMRIDVIDLHADRERESFLGRYPRFEEIAGISFHECSCESRETARLFELWAQDQRMLSTAAVCFSDDTRSISAALHIGGNIDTRDMPVLVRLSGEGGITALLGRDSTVGPKLLPFGMAEKTASRETIANESQDQLARAMHNEYVLGAMAGGAVPGSKPALVSWDRLDHFYRDSNRQQADHLAVKVRAIGAELIPAAEADGREPFALWPEEVEVLARMEHRRWCAHYLLAGYLAGARDDAARRHPDLVEWEQLSEQMRDYDREPVRRIGAYAAMIGMAIVRVR